MRILFVVLFLCGIGTMLTARGTTDSLSAVFPSPSSKMLKIPFLKQESLYLLSDDSNLLIVMEIADPQLMMRLMMEGLSMYIDPTGRKKEKYEVIVPAISREQLKSLPEDETNQPAEVQDSIRRPNILPLVDLINKDGAAYMVNGRRMATEKFHFTISVDMDRECVLYSFMIPLERLMNEKKVKETWSVGIYSTVLEPISGDEQMMPPPPPMNEGNEFEDMSGDISEWIQFSIDELNSLNM